jgi:UbiD family decarboxylase
MQKRSAIVGAETWNGEGARPYEDMHEFLELLEERGDLQRVRRPVDRDFEIAWVTKRSIDTGGPALLFENVKGFETPVVTALAGTVDRCLLGLSTTREEWPHTWSRAVSNLQPWSVVGTGPCKDVVLGPGKLNLERLPILWHYEKDAGHYISSGLVLTKDPDTGRQNVGIYRCLVVGPDKLAIYMNWQDGKDIAAKYMARGEPCPVAVVVGTDPALLHSAAIKVPYGIDEFEVAGAIRGQAVEMTPCETIDMHVPASADLVIEGEFVPGDEEGFIGRSSYCAEGPFGEYTGYYGEERRSPILSVTAVTHRSDMIYHGLVIGIPPGESTMMYSALRWVEMYDAVRRVVPAEHIRGINIPPEAGNALCVVSVRKTRPGQGKLIAAAALAVGITVKKCIVVDDDIDPGDLGKVVWATEQRSRWEDQFSFEATGSQLDPVARLGNLVTKIGIDATVPLGGDKEGRHDILSELGPCYAPVDEIDLDDYLDPRPDEGP